MAKPHDTLHLNLQNPKNATEFTSAAQAVRALVWERVCIALWNLRMSVLIARQVQAHPDKLNVDVTVPLIALLPGVVLADGMKRTRFSVTPTAWFDSMAAASLLETASSLHETEWFPNPKLARPTDKPTRDPPLLMTATPDSAIAIDAVARLPLEVRLLDRHVTL